MADTDVTQTSNSAPRPAYWDEACRALAGCDPVLAELIHTHSADTLRGSGDAFQTLVNAIVGQQISVAAAAGIWKRLTQAYPGLPREALSTAELSDLRATGLSWRKAEYIRGIAEAFASGSIQDATWADRTDDEIRRELTSLRGVGPWTADMLLIFHMQRPDVLPLGDIGLVNAAAGLYRWNTDDAETAAQRLAARQAVLEAHAQQWRPWRTVATWFIWRDLDAEPVIY